MNNDQQMMFSLLLVGGIALVFFLTRDNTPPPASYIEIASQQVPVYENDEEYEWTDYKGNIRHMRIKRNVKELRS